MAFDTIEEPTETVAGHFIPLSCGHNGYFTPTEKQKLEKHLLNSGFVETIIDSSRVSSGSSRTSNSRRNIQ